MWQGIIPAVTTKFHEDGSLDFKEMERCYDFQIESGVDGLIACGSLGEGPMLTHDERIDALKAAQHSAKGKPALLTIAEASTDSACRLAERAAKAGASGLMVVPSTIYHSDRDETLETLRAVASASDLPIMIYSNRLGYRVDVTNEMLLELTEDKRFVAVKESSGDIRRTTEAVAMLGDRMQVFTGVDNYAYEAFCVGAVGWVCGLTVAFPKESVAIYKLVKAGRHAEALKIYQWFRPLLDLDVSNYLVQNVKLVETLVLNSNEHVRRPRMPLKGEQRKFVERVVSDALRTRPELPSI